MTQPWMFRVLMVWLTVGLAIPVVAEEAAPQPDLRQKVVCRVDGHDIHAGQVQEEMNKLLPWSSYHGHVSAEKQKVLLRQALEKVIVQELEYQEALRRQLKVSNREIEKRLKQVIKRYPNKKEFYKQLKGFNFTVDDVKAELKRRALITKIEDLVADPNRKVTDEEARHYYETHLEQFREPKRAVVREIMITVPILGRNEKVWADAKKKADDAFTRIESGEPFADVVRLVSDAPEKEKEAGGLLGTLHKGRLSPKLDKVVWSLPAGRVSRPVRTLKGYFVLKVDRFLPAKQVPFAKLHKSLRKQLQTRWAADRVTQLRKELRSKAKVEYLLPSLKPVAGEAPAAIK